MKTKKISIGMGILVGIILFTSCVFAFGVSMPYMENKELYLLPGEAIDLEFVLQGGRTTEELTIKASVLEGLAIMQITDPQDIYSIPVGERAKVNTQVNIPSNAKIGDTYPVKLFFSTIATTGAGTFGIGSAIEQNFDVIIGEKPAKEKAAPPSSETEKLKSSSSYLIFAVIALAIIAVIILVTRKKKAQS